MTAFSLMRHAIGLLIQQPLKTLTVVGPALLLMIVISIVAAVTAPELLAGGKNAEGVQALPTNWLLLAGLVFSYSMMAILWHRYTLGAETSLRPLSITLVLGYLWRVCLLTVIQLSVSVLLVIPLILSSRGGDPAIGGPAFQSIMLTTFITQLFLVWLSLRLSLILPAAAIGQPIPMAVSWRYTQPLSRALWSVGAMLALFNTVLAALVTYFDLNQPQHLLMLELPVYVLEGLLIFSLLTTLYARQVEKPSASSA